jgi:D-3-phosphoglycerate dehydrogenase
VEKVRIAVADGSIADAAWVNPVAKELGVELIYGAVSTPEEVRKTTDGCEALLVSLQKMSPEIITAFAPTVKAIGRLGVGLDSINLEAAKAAKVSTIYQPGYAINEVSNHAVAMILALNRGLFVANEMVMKNGWGSANLSGVIHSLQDSTVGVIGSGRIGQAVISKIKPFVKKVIAFDLVKPQNVDGYEFTTDLDSLISQCQFITLHTPYLPSTHHIMDSERIALMPKGSILVNVSRGGLIDEVALAAALNSEHLSAAGIDVFQIEPLPDNSPLRTAKNIILSPHTAWYSQSSAPRLVEWTIRDVVSFIKTNAIANGAFAVGPF